MTWGVNGSVGAPSQGGMNVIWLLGTFAFSRRNISEPQCDPARRSFSCRGDSKRRSFVSSLIKEIVRDDSC